MSEHEWLMFGSRPRSVCGCVCEPQNPWRRTLCRSWVTAFMHLPSFFVWTIYVLWQLLKFCSSSYTPAPDWLEESGPVPDWTLRYDSGKWEWSLKMPEAWGMGLEKDKWEGMWRRVSWIRNKKEIKYFDKEINYSVTNRHDYFSNLLLHDVVKHWKGFESDHIQSVSLESGPISQVC